MARSKGGIQVLRMETRSDVTGALAAHIIGEHVHEVHEPKPGEQMDITVLVDDRERAAAYLQGLKVHGNAKPGVEFVVGGCRDDMSREEEDAYFMQSLQWIREHAGEHSMLSAACIHRHEQSPHMQVLMVAVGMADKRAQAAKVTRKDGKVRYRYRRTDEQVRRVGWTAIRDGFSPGKGRDADRLSRMQDCFHEEVASHFGLERGEKGSQTTHEEIDRRKAAEQRAAEAELKAEQAQARAEQARAAAERDTKAAQEVRERREAEEAALAKAETERREKARAATLMAEDERRAELELQTAAGRRLERVEAKIGKVIAVGSAGRVGRQAKRGQAILGAHLAALKRVRGERDRATAGRKTERERADTECARADTGEKDVKRLTGELTRANESMQRISEYVIGKMREHVDRWYGRVEGVSIVHQAMADTLEWAKVKFVPGWEPEAVVRIRERERQAAAQGAPAVHPGRDTGSGL